MDEIYYEQDRSKNAQTKKNVPIHDLEETEKQAWRIRLCIHQGLSSRKIAKLEGLHYRTIQDSLVLAKKKIEKFLHENI